MISCPSVRKQVIRHHYDLTSPFYWLLWGRHIHHGLWEGDESAPEAQKNLTRTLAQLAGIRPSSRLLDIGCGLGGSSIYLAQHLNCKVTGITLSSVQQRWAGVVAQFGRVGKSTKFLCGDVELIDFPDSSFDVIWSIECTEHLFDKGAFFDRASHWLRPGGTLAICAWLAHESPDSEQAQLAYDVCEGFFCPSLGSRLDYVNWIETAGMSLDQYHDWSDRVAKTWDICLRRSTQTGMPWVARLFDSDTVMFVNRFKTMIDAYRTQAMRYGCFIGHKPG